MGCECDHPDWLPVGWRVTVKPRTISGKKDKYYIDPSNGRKFKSMPEVHRYLKCSGKDRKAKSSVKIEVRSAITRKLPPGWIKEIRTKKRLGKTRRDPTYIDPVSGRHFRSMQEVFRYLESKDSRKAKTKNDAAKPSHHLTTGAKEDGLVDKKPDKNLIRHDHVNSGPKLKPTGGMKSNQRDVCLGIEFSNKLQKVKRRPDKLRELKNLTNNKVVVEGQTPKSGAVNEKEQCIGRRQSKRLADIQLKDLVTANHSGTVEKNINKRESAKRNWAGILPRRTSPRLAHAEVNPSSEVKTITKTGGDSDADVSNMESIHKCKAGQWIEAEPDNKGKSPNIKMENTTNNHLKKTKPIAAGEKKSLQSALENMLMDPCIEFAIKTLTGAIPIEDASKVTNSPVAALAQCNQTPASSSTMPSSVDIWSDPCFQFAVKTLTGEAPAQFQSFQPPHATMDRMALNSGQITSTL